MLLLLRDRKPGVLTNLAPLFSLTMWQVLKKQKWNLRRLSISSNNLHALPKWVRVSPRAFSWSVHRVQVKHLFHVLWRVEVASHSFSWAGPQLWRCSFVWVAHVFETPSKKPKRTPLSFFFYM